MVNDYDQFYEILRKNNYKATNQRLTVFEAFLENPDKHMTIEEIYQHIIIKKPSIGIATVYRNVQLLTKLDILEKLNFNDGSARYESALDKNKEGHNHFICDNCKKIIEITEDLYSMLEKTLEKNYDFLVLDHQIKFTGLCKNCREKT